MRLVLVCSILAAAAVVPQIALAQEQPEIVVTGERSQERVRTFVDQIALGEAGNALARWSDRICVGAVGLAADQAQALVDRISARAQAVGLRAGEPGCRANVMVIFASDSDVLSRQIVDQRRDLLGFYGDTGEVTAGREAMEAFASTPRAIRWWHVSSTGAGSLRLDAARDQQRNAGRAAARAAAGDSGGAGNGGSSVEDVQGIDAVRSNGSRARQELRNDLKYALIVVDARRVAGVPASAWMDFAAMAAMAQMDPDAQISGFPSILNVFAEPSSGVREMTAWDIAFLDGLYRARSTDARRQTADIARRIGDAIPN